MDVSAAGDEWCAELYSFGGGTDGGEDGVVSARGVHFGLFGKGGAGRYARRKPPRFFQKKPEKIFLEICKLLP